MFAWVRTIGADIWNKNVFTTEIEPSDPGSMDHGSVYAAWTEMGLHVCSLIIQHGSHSMITPVIPCCLYFTPDSSSSRGAAVGAVRWRRHFDMFAARIGRVAGCKRSLTGSW